MSDFKSDTSRSLASARLQFLARAAVDRPDEFSAESGYPDFDASSWFGLVGPAGLSSEVVVKIASEMARALKNPELREKFIQQGADPVGSSPEEFGEYMRAETAKWAKLVKAAGAKVD